jgi:hypothetical protein
MEKDWIGFELRRPSMCSSEAASFIAFCATDFAGRMVLCEPFAGDLVQVLGKLRNKKSFQNNLLI